MPDHPPLAAASSLAAWAALLPEGGRGCVAGRLGGGAAVALLPSDSWLIVEAGALARALSPRAALGTLALALASATLPLLVPVGSFWEGSAEGRGGCWTGC